MLIAISRVGKKRMNLPLCPSVKVQVIYPLFVLSGYWMGLAASVNFPGNTIEKCLQVLHTDILRVWNIQDLGVNTSISSSLLTLTQIVLLVPGQRGTENANDRTCWESI